MVLEGLVQLMLGAPHRVYHGGLLHCRLFYFDPQRRRPGVPPDVAALVERVTADSVSVQLVNLHPTEGREVIVQAGAFGEHRFTSLRQAGEAVSIDGQRFQVRLAPAAQDRLDLGMKRYVEQPSYARPWDAQPPSGACP